MEDIYKKMVITYLEDNYSENIPKKKIMKKWFKLHKFNTFH